MGNRERDRLSLPEELEDLELIVSVSGGKDSTALLLAVREAGLPHRAVFADTGWEADETYEYLDYLRAKLELTIDVVGVPGGMEARIHHRAGFPARMQRWCTRELKLQPLRAYHDAVEESGVETVAVLGVRAEESVARSKMSVLEDEPAGDRSWGGWVWRPLIDWSVEDVLRTHHRHGVAVNPLYRRGHDRVGCYPCIYARKEEIRLVAEYAPGQIAKIRRLEQEVVQIRRVRNEEKPGRYELEVGTFFQGRSTKRGFESIDEVVSWSQTVRGGRQFPLLMEPPTGGCMRWGLCEQAPVAEAEAGA